MSSEQKKSIYNDLYKTEIPFLMMSNQIHIEMFSNKNLTIDGEFSVLEYSDIMIVLKLKKGLLNILGAELSIMSVTDSRIFIVGNIISLEFDTGAAD